MKKVIIALGLLLIVNISFGQLIDSSEVYSNIATQMMNQNSKLTIGGYGHVDYNQPLDGDIRNNGKLDVHRLVMLFGYKFNERTQFITELEFEHVKEVYVEQAFLDYKINNLINFRAGLLLVPMGIINEYHEPTAFNGVERPLVDKYIAPTTWREIGLGLTGNIPAAQLKYQAYLLNGFNGYDGAGKFSGKNGLRKGRQKGAESFISSPNISAKAEYYGIRGLSVGFSGYVGKSQSVLYDGLDKSDNAAIASADSSVIGMNMIGLDARYSISGLQIKGQLYFNKLSNTDQYNEFTGNDLGSSMIGYYAEVGYNVFKTSSTIESQLIPFLRYEHYNTQQSMASGFVANDAYNVNMITTGIGWKMAKGAVLKADMQFVKSAADTEYSKIFNAGIGVMF